MIRKKKEKAFAIYPKIYIPSIYKQCYTDYLYTLAATTDSQWLYGLKNHSFHY